MAWFKRLKKSEEPSLIPQKVLPEDPMTISLETFKRHWRQAFGIICATSKTPPFVKTKETSLLKTTSLSSTDVETVRNLMEQMIFLLIEEQSSGQLFGPILDFAVSQGVFEKLYIWWETLSSFKEQVMLNLLKFYEQLISQAQHSLLHHKQLVTPMLQLLSNDNQPKNSPAEIPVITYGFQQKIPPPAASDELDGQIVLLLNLLCVWMNRDPTLLEVFFNASANHGPANFLIFSLLIEYIHREGTVGQQARDALLLCMSLSAENSTVADYIVHHSNFCPVLATGLSGLYSTLPRHMKVRADDWHCLQKSDWSHVPELINFMNSFEFCNSVIEVSSSMVSEQLLDYLYNGFLVSVFGPSLHKTSANEVAVTTAYLNLFLRSVTASALMRCFLRFLLTHRHESSLIINTLIQRIGSGNRLALVSLSLIRTLIDLNCEDLMLQLVFRYLVPCQHILASQRRSIRDVDIYNASASRFLALTPTVCASQSPSDKEDEIFLPVVNVGKSPANNEVSSMNMKPLPVGKETSNHTEGNSPFHSLSPPPSTHESAPIKPTFYNNSTNHGIPPANGVNHAISEYTVNEDLSVTVNMHPATQHEVKTDHGFRTRTITSPSTMAEFGPDLQSQLQLNTSYMDYLEDAKAAIDQCREACVNWSAAYDGAEPAEESPLHRNVKSSKEEEGTQSQTSSASAKISKDTLEVTTPSIPIPDTLHSSTCETTMKALSATYQALNITAQAFSKTSSSPPSLRSPETEQLPKSTKPVSSECDANISEPAKSSLVEQTSSNIAKPSSCHESTSTHLSSTHNIPPDGGSRVPGMNHVPRESIQEDFEKTDTATTVSTRTSSVDEFFRSLMEIVPKTTRDKVEPKKVNEAREEDIESGIEMSSDGDGQASSNDQFIDGVNSDGQDREDTMSQLSLNTDEINEEAERSNDDIGKEINSFRKYSYGEESDDELDDTSSVTSSSFYEPVEEYEPTEVSVAPIVSLKLQGIPYTGPLIGNLFAKLDQMISNSLYENLLLTGIVARLAAYPQPLLRSFLLNTHMVFHPSVRSLYQVLTSARNKIDAYAAEVSDFKVLVRRAQKYLLARGTYPFSGDARTKYTVQNHPMPVPKVKSRTLGEMFKRKKHNTAKKRSILPSLDTLIEISLSKSRDSSSKGTNELSTPSARNGTGPNSTFYVKAQRQEKEERKIRELRTKNAVYASIVLAEFLKELAAVAQEHAVAHV